MTEAQTPAPELAEEVKYTDAGLSMWLRGRSTDATISGDHLASDLLRQAAIRLDARTRPAPASDREGLVTKFGASKVIAMEAALGSVRQSNPELFAAILAQLPAGYAAGVGDAATMQPWSSAPKDGTVILAYDEASPTYFYAVVWEDGEWHYCSQGVGWAAPPGTPTEWMPLPKRALTPDAGADRDH